MDPQSRQPVHLAKLTDAGEAWNSDEQTIESGPRSCLTSCVSHSRVERWITSWMATSGEKERRRIVGSPAKRQPDALIDSCHGTDTELVHGGLI